MVVLTNAPLQSHYDPYQYSYRAQIDCRAHHQRQQGRRSNLAQPDYEG